MSFMEAKMERTVLTMLKIAETADMMTSRDYKQRFLAEYAQLYERREKLWRTIARYRAGTLDFNPPCPLDLLEKQSDAMDLYFNILNKRAELEGIDLEEIMHG